MTEYLYRLYDEADTLLYVGISKSAIHRLHQHLESQPWAGQVAKQTVQRYATRQLVEAAEVEAIKSERPLHNKTHNSKTSVSGGVNFALSVVKPGDCVALGMNDGECLVGQVEVLDDVWIRLTLKNWLIGWYCGDTVVVRFDDVVKFVVVSPYDDDGCQVVDDERLGDFQTKWHQQHGTRQRLAGDEDES